MYSVERETPIRGGQLRGTKGGGGNTWPKQQQTSPSALMPDGPRAQTDQRAGNLPDLGLRVEERSENKNSKETFLKENLTLHKTVQWYPKAYQTSRRAGADYPNPGKVIGLDHHHLEKSLSMLGKVVCA